MGRRYLQESGGQDDSYIFPGKGPVSHPWAKKNFEQGFLHHDENARSGAPAVDAPVGGDQRFNELVAHIRANGQDCSRAQQVLKARHEDSQDVGLGTPRYCSERNRLARQSGTGDLGSRLGFAGGTAGGISELACLGGVAGSFTGGAGWLTAR
jgi:hypothetical protein